MTSEGARYHTRPISLGVKKNPVISFTGTRQGMTIKQKERVEAILRTLSAPLTVVHGCCVGADVEFHRLVRKVHGRDAYVIGRPSTVKSTNRAKDLDLDLCADPFTPSVRDKHIVDHGRDLLIACPLQREEVLRSGTWTTVRYAWRRGVPVQLVLP